MSRDTYSSFSLVERLRMALQVNTSYQRTRVVLCRTLTSPARKEHHDTSRPMTLDGLPDVNINLPSGAPWRHLVHTVPLQTSVYSKEANNGPVAALLVSLLRLCLCACCPLSLSVPCPAL